MKHFPDVGRFEIIKTVKIQADTLDNQLAENNIDVVDFIKIDTEGYELPILNGSQNTLKDVIGLEVEVSFLPIHENRPLFHDVNKFVVDQGFELFDLRRTFWKRRNPNNYYDSTKGQIIWGDTLYFRTPEYIINDKHLKPNKIIKALFVYLVYGYYDIACELCRLAAEKQLLSKSLLQTLDRLIKQKRRTLFLPNFKGKNRIYHVLKRIAEAFSMNTFCSGGDEKLGN